MIDGELNSSPTVADIATSGIITSIDNADELTKAEEIDWEVERQRSILNSFNQDITQRKEYADKIYCMIVVWLLAIFLLLLLVGYGNCRLSDQVLITLIGGTTINVLGIFAIVANYIFRKPKN